MWNDRLEARQAGRVIGHRLTRSATDPNEVEVVMQFAVQGDAEAYRDYMNMAETRSALAAAGVEEHAPMWIGEEIEAASY